jgi:hypothetical protein
MRVNLSKYSSDNKKLKIIKELIKQFCVDNDIKHGVIVNDYVNTPGGAKALANWAKYKGYKVSYWCLEPLKTKNVTTNTNDTIWIAFGIDIDENCELITELKLKQ